VDGVDPYARVSVNVCQHPVSTMTPAYLQQLLCDLVPAPPRLGAVGQVSQVAEQTAIADFCFLTGLITLVEGMWADVFKDLLDNIWRETSDVVASRRCRLGIVNLSAWLFVGLELGTRPEVLQQTHDASLEGAVVIM
jgi:hypothetical protein